CGGPARWGSPAVTCRARRALPATPSPPPPAASTAVATCPGTAGSPPGRPRPGEIGGTPRPPSRRGPPPGDSCSPRRPARAARPAEPVEQLTDIEVGAHRIEAEREERGEACGHALLHRLEGALLLEDQVVPPGPVVEHPEAQVTGPQRRPVSGDVGEGGRQ